MNNTGAGHPHLTPLEIAGVALYSECTKEIVSTIKAHIETQDEQVFAACAHAVGHLAWRFHFDVAELEYQIAIHCVRFDASDLVRGAIFDMNNEIKSFLT